MRKIPRREFKYSRLNLTLSKDDTLPEDVVLSLAAARVVILDATKHYWTEGLARILQQPPLAQLESLLLPQIIPRRRLLDTMKELQSLHHLKLNVRAETAHANLYAGLAQLQCLTSLDLNFVRKEDGYASADGLLDYIRPPMLKQLTLRNAQFGTDGFRILASAPFNQLQRPRLIDCITHAVGLWEAGEILPAVTAKKADFAAVFATMRDLETIELHCVNGLKHPSASCTTHRRCACCVWQVCTGISAVRFVHSSKWSSQQR